MIVPRTVNSGCDDFCYERPLPLTRRLTKTYIQYVRRYYPDVEIDSVLRQAGITPYQIEDPAHWFTQAEVDGFHEALTQHTGDSDISRKPGALRCPPRSAHSTSWPYQYHLPTHGKELPCPAGGEYLTHFKTPHHQIIAHLSPERPRIPIMRNAWLFEALTLTIGFAAVEHPGVSTGGCALLGRPHLEGGHTTCLAPHPQLVRHRARAGRGILRHAALRDLEPHGPNAAVLVGLPSTECRSEKCWCKPRRPAPFSRGIPAQRGAVTTTPC
jgi:hypothetical protein